MKIDLNDPRITAFALGELTGDDAVELARAVRSDERVSKAVEEVRGAAQLLGGALSPGGAEMLTPNQRHAIRSAGASPVIEDIASAQVPFWKKPAVVATSVAAAVAATLYIVGGGNPANDDDVVEQKPEWNWSQVATGDLTAPVSLDVELQETTSNSPNSAHAVSAAASDDTDGFREAVSRRIKSSELKAAQDLPELHSKDLQDVEMGKEISVPMSSGATSWPWVRRHIMDAGKLPPHRAVRIEEMINHFSYRKPDMIKHGGLAADMELCHNPWNPQAYLLAVHTQALPGADVGRLTVSLVVASDRVKKLRLLGYAKTKMNSTAIGAPALASRTRGNYVIYELQISDSDSEDVDTPLVLLNLGGDKKLANNAPKTWIHASSDLRFASLIAATGMMLSDYPSPGELDAARLASMSDMLQQSDGESTSFDREKAINVVLKALEIIEDSAN